MAKQVLKTYEYDPDYDYNGVPEEGISDVSKKVNTETKKYMLIHNINDYERAMKIVLELDPDLKAEYTKIV